MRHRRGLCLPRYVPGDTFVEERQASCHTSSCIHHTISPLSVRFVSPPSSGTFGRTKKSINASRDEYVQCPSAQMSPFFLVGPASYSASRLRIFRHRPRIVRPVRRNYPRTNGKKKRGLLKYNTGANETKTKLPPSFTI